MGRNKSLLLSLALCYLSKPPIGVACEAASWQMRNAFAEFQFRQTRVEYRRLDLNLRKDSLIISTVRYCPFTFNLSVSYVLAVYYTYGSIWSFVIFIQSWSVLTVKFEIFAFIIIAYIWFWGFHLFFLNYLYYYTFHLCLFSVFILD